jgi:hypothetical protein
LYTVDEVSLPVTFRLVAKTEHYMLIPNIRTTC